MLLTRFRLVTQSHRFAWKHDFPHAQILQRNDATRLFVLNTNTRSLLIYTPSCIQRDGCCSYRGIFKIIQAVIGQDEPASLPRLHTAACPQIKHNTFRWSYSYSLSIYLTRRQWTQSIQFNRFTIKIIKSALEFIDLTVCVISSADQKQLNLYDISCICSVSHLSWAGFCFTQFEQPSLSVRVEEGVRQIVPIILWDFEGFVAYAVVEILLMQRNTHFHQNPNLRVSAACWRHWRIINTSVFFVLSYNILTRPNNVTTITLWNAQIIFHGNSYIHSINAIALE